jgi:rubrerythrin
MNGRLQECIVYLKSAKNLELHAANLYDALSKKINQPESSFILSFSCDSQKCAKMIEALLNCFDLTAIENIPLRKDASELIVNVVTFNKRIARTNNVGYEIACEFFREISALEDQLCSMYAIFIKSSLSAVLAVEFSRLSIDSTNFNRIFEDMANEKQKHKETLIDVIYAFETKEAERFRSGTTQVLHKTPDPRLQNSAFHVFPSTPIPQRPQK